MTRDRLEAMNAEIERTMGARYQRPPFVNEGAGVFDLSIDVRGALKAFSTAVAIAGSVETGWNEFQRLASEIGMTGVLGTPRQQARAEVYHRVIEVAPDAARRTLGIELESTFDDPLAPIVQ